MEKERERDDLFNKLKESKEVGHKFGDYLRKQNEEVLA